MTFQDFNIVPVRYEGGSLDGTVNELDHAEHELREELDSGACWDWTPATVDSTREDVIERYRLEHRPGDGWVYVYTGTFERPVEDRNFTAEFVGGPRDGQSTVFLGSIRQRLAQATWLFPGYRLVHDGPDPLTGWQMRHDPTPAVDEQSGDQR
ncbi:hypothetical protein [Polymorphospora sp. NPDC050346]|uniref:hypothetical protein n=1 Tax=Polymorphospora sp. NPDC050346 TaxID=3155780 RepID=UPI0033F3F6F9